MEGTLFTGLARVQSWSSGCISSPEEEGSKQATLPKDSFKNLADRWGNGGCVTRKLPGCVACPINKCLVHPLLYFLVLSKMQELKGKRVSGEALSEITKANVFNQVVAAAHCSPSRHIQGAVIAFAVLTVPRWEPSAPRSIDFSLKISSATGLGLLCLGATNR